MAKLFPWLCLLSVALCAALTNAQSQTDTQQLDPVYQSQLSNDALEGDVDRADREKRLGIIKKIGLKAGLLDFVFGKIDSFIDAKTRAINEFDKQNIYKNEKYFGITPPPRNPHPQNNLVGTLFTIKKNLLGSAVSGFIQAKLSGNGNGGHSNAFSFGESHASSNGY